MFIVYRSCYLRGIMGQFSLGIYFIVSAAITSAMFAYFNVPWIMFSCDIVMFGTLLSVSNYWLVLWFFSMRCSHTNADL